MCGIAYYKPGNSFKIVTLLKILYTLEQRGKDSWGFVATDSKRKKVFTNKAFGKIKKISIVLKTFRLYKKGMSDFIYHSGLATSGISGITENLQPIEMNRIYLTHNGLILSPELINTSEVDENLSDSFKLSKILTELEENEYEKFLNSLDGEISLIFLDLGAHKIYGYTNVGGLYAGKNYDCTILSSEILHKNWYEVNNGKEILNLEKVKVRKIFEVGSKND
jgi:glucosamine 6-phosphate synthetase-like amidotransferase/phosphosugar isomerase protein